MKKNIYIEENIKNANLALKNRLYVSGWMLSQELTFIRERKENAQDYIVKLNYNSENKPVGVITYNKTTKDIMIFVRKSERGKGIGTQLIYNLRRTLHQNNIDQNLKYSDGINGSNQFFGKAVEKTKLKLMNEIISKTANNITNATTNLKDNFQNGVENLECMFETINAIQQENKPIKLNQIKP